MAGQQRVFKQKIKATQTLEKVFRAMEMIAASRIGRARERATKGDSYTRSLTQAVAAVAVHTDIDHPLTEGRTDDCKRVAVLVIAADRGLAGAYSANIIRSTEKLLEELREEGKQPVLFTSGRRATQYFGFRGVPIEKSWEGNSDNPEEETMYEVGDTLLKYFMNPDPKVGVAAVELVFTRFKSMVSQSPEIRQMLPLTIVDARHDGDEEDSELGFGPDGKGFPEYEFIPGVSAVLDTLLPLYVSNRIANAMLQSAASELASKQRAMHTATENAGDLIRDYTRLANQARQAEITQEISEIVSGADALANQAQ